MAASALKVVLIGAGRMGAIRGRAAVANPRLHLAGVVQSRTDSAARLAQALGCGVVTLEVALADPSIAGIVVASSTDTHLAFAQASLAAGKAVFCEKPLDLALTRLRAAAPSFTGGPSVYVAFNRRFDPHFQRLKARIDVGEIGPLETLHVINHDPAPPPPAFIATSGGLFRDFAIHDFDTARWLMDEEPVSVFALASCLVDPAIGAAGDVDTARIVLTTASNRLCVISNSRRSGYGYDQRVEAFGAKGMARVDNPRADTLERWSAAGARLAPISSGFVERYAEAYAREMDHFAEVLAGEVPPATGYDDNVRALALADAAVRSVATGARVNVADV
ncbi:MAG TPA: Gfo/Idh/MocA family oxidoreductase [Caulobacteraceae bacterium]|nr:Gfo/Idh/MocA family oxidoreductase [Caulobacteraceae bacterium]